MKIPKFIKKLYLKPLDEYETWLLEMTKSDKPETMSFPLLTMKQYRKMLERDDLYR